jgi:FtsP/CotA-like multicopper oxidase with cupredoxin domain
LEAADEMLMKQPLPNGFPWGNKNPQHDDPKNPPHTGVTRYYDFTIARTTISPDGVVKPAILINGQYPGPTIEANWGDQIQGKYDFNLEMLNSGTDITVSVHNNITGPEEGTSLHWHGLLQKDTPWMDGVPSVTQCPIAPGSSFT